MQTQNLDNFKLLKFYSSRCAPCKVMEPIVKKVLNNFENIELIDVNIDNDPDIAINYKIRTIPALVLIKDNEIMDILIGNVGEDIVKTFLYNNIL